MPDWNANEDDHYPEREGEPGEEPDETESVPEPMGAAFFHEVMSGLADTNFARGWNDPAMYRDFLSWCESSEEADAIISRFSPQIPSLLVDPDDNVRFVSLHASVAAELMRALLDEYEQRRVEEFLSR